MYSLILYIVICFLWSLFCSKVEKVLTGRKSSYVTILNFVFMPISMIVAIRNVKNTFKYGIPKNATVFAVKETLDSPTGLQAYIGYKTKNNDFHFEQIPFEDSPKNAVVRVNNVVLKDNGGIFEIRKVDSIKYCNYCESHATYQVWVCNKRIVQKQASLTLCDTCFNYLKMLIVSEC